MRTLQSQLLIFCIAALSISCDSSWFNRPVSKSIATLVQPDRSGIQFGGELPFFTANIKVARSECIPYRNPVDKDTKPDSREFHYKLAVTADVVGTVIDQTRAPSIPMNAKIRIEARSSNDVVLGFADAEVQFHSGQSTEQASATIYGLNEYEIERVSRIQVYWLYSR